MPDMGRRPRLLDLFCGAGGAAVGYHRAGFDVVGVDIVDQPHYPFTFHRADAMTWPLNGFDAVHASPPCQAFTQMSARWRGRGGVADTRTDLLTPTLDRLRGVSVPWVVENVQGAAARMPNAFVLNGAMFPELGTHRPRLFVSNVLILVAQPARPIPGNLGVYGRAPDGRRTGTDRADNAHRVVYGLLEAHKVMGMDWADWHGTKEAVPPAYTEHIGRQLIGYVVT